LTHQVYHAITVESPSWPTNRSWPNQGDPPPIT